MTMTNTEMRKVEIKDFNFNYTSESIIKFISSKNANFICAGLDKDKLLALINFLANNLEDSFSVKYLTADGLDQYITHGLPSTKQHWFNQAEKENTKHTLSLNISEDVNELIIELAKDLNIKRSHLFLLILLFEYKPQGIFDKSETNFFKALANLKEFKLFDDAANRPFNLSTDNNELFYSLNDDSGLTVSPEHEKLFKKMLRLSGETSFVDIKPALFEICKKELDKYPVSKVRVNIKKKIEATKTADFENIHYEVKAINLDGQVIQNDLVPIRFSLDDLENLYLQNMEYYKSAYMLLITNEHTQSRIVFSPTLLEKAKNKSMFLMHLTVPFEKWLDFYTGKVNRSRSSFFRQAFMNNLHSLKQQLEEFKADPDNSYSDIAKGMEIFERSISV